jgi:WD40 repeat protein
MNRQQAVKAIEGPCNYAGIEIEEKFPEKLLEKLNPKSTEIELTFLQIYLDKLYKKSDQKFSIKLIDETGNVDNILGDFLDEQIELLKDPETGLKILKSFVSIKGTKRQITFEEAKDSLLTFGSEINEKVLIEYIRQFVNLRILRDQDENGRYELVHDNIAQHIYDKITLIEREIFEVRQFIENAFNSYEKREILLTQEDLDYITRFEASLILPEKHQEFISISRVYYQKQNYTIKIISAVSAGFLIIMLIVGTLYFKNTVKQRQAFYDATSAMNIVSSVEYNFKKAVDAYKSDGTTIALKAVIFSFNKLLDAYKSDHTRTISKYLKDYLIEFPKYSADIKSAGFSKDGKIIYGFLSNSKVKIWSIKGNELLSIDSVNRQILDIKLSDNNQYLAVVCKDSTANIYDIRGNTLFTIKTQYNPRNINDIVRFTHDNKFVISLHPIYDVAIFNLEGKLIQNLKLHGASVNSLAVSENNQFIATASSDKSIAVWYYNRIRSKYSLYKQFSCHKDTVWSVQFSTNNKYLLSASADSTAVIWNLNGDKTRDVDDYIKSNSYMKNLVSNKRLSACNKAEFSYDESFIIISRYNLNKANLIDQANNNMPPLYGQFNHTLNTDTSLPIKTASSEIITNGENGWWNYLFYSSQVKNTFYDIAISPNSKYSAIVNNEVNKTKLILVEGNLLLLDLIGNHPVFSPEGDFLLTINKNQIQLSFINIDKIVGIHKHVSSIL